jgi:hypothetical protein
MPGGRCPGSHHRERAERDAGLPGDVHAPAVLGEEGALGRDVEKMHAAWVKSCLLQVTLWSHPYVKDGDF